MPTRASITVKKSDGKYYSIYSHFDGYIKGGVGETLTKYYDNQEAAEQLVSFGDASSIGKTIQDCEFYARDRREKIRPASVSLSVYEALHGNRQEYDYVWDGNSWYVMDYSTAIPSEKALVV